MKGLIVVGASIAQKPFAGGLTWVYLQYLLGFRQLGWEVLFLDRLEPDMCVDATGAPCPPEDSTNLRYFHHVMQAFGLDGDFAVACDKGSRFIGLSRDQVLERVKAADTFVNVMGFFTDEEVLAGARHRVFLDIDPGFGQMWCALGLHNPYDGYDRYVTVGERVGHADCGVPTCGLTWIATRQPVVLEHWPMTLPAPGGSFTSVAAWRGPYGPVDFQGKTYGLRVHEFRKFVTLPRRSPESFEIALNIHAAETSDLALLSENRWRLVDPRAVARDPAAYRDYIAGSKAEFMAAKNMYVETRSGWFSDRSICYLASGKPVLAQDTGLADLYPLGQGLLTFSTLDEAEAGADEISGNYERHCRAAREIASACFDSDKVLSHLLHCVGSA